MLFLLNITGFCTVLRAGSGSGISPFAGSVGYTAERRLSILGKGNVSPGRSFHATLEFVNLITVFVKKDYLNILAGGNSGSDFLWIG